MNLRLLSFVSAALTLLLWPSPGEEPKTENREPSWEHADVETS